MNMNLAKVAIKRPVSMCMIVLALLVFGISSIFSAPVELMPEIDIPMLIVATVYPGAGPEDVESLVTKEIEDAVSTLSGVKHVTSTSSENQSMVMLEMNYGTNMDIAHMDIQEQIDMLSNSLPEDAMTPMVIEININTMQDTVSISAATTADMDLLYTVEEDIVPQFEKLNGVASVSTSGGKKDYISVELDETQLQQYGLTMNTIIGYVSQADFSLPLGTADRGDESITLHGGVSYNSAESLKSIPIALPSGDVIHLSDVANVHESTEEQSSISRYNGSENINIGIQKRQSASTLAVARNVKSMVEELNEKNSGVTLEIINSTDEQILSSISTVITTLIIAIILAMLVLYLFMGDWKASLIIGTSIPISLMMTLTLMNAFGFSFNIVSLTALIISIGNMVDNSVVVLDSCFAVQEKIKTPAEAAIEGTQFVMTSQIAGTLASIVTFLPLGFMTGMSGQMFKPLALTIVFASIASVLSALTLVPLLFAVIKPKEKKDIAISRGLAKLRKFYVAFMKKSFRHKKVVVLSSVGLLVVSIFLATTLDFELITDSDEGIISIETELKPGLQVDYLNEAILPLEEMVAAHPDVESYSLTGGTGNSLLGSGKSSTIMVYLRKDRNVKTAELVEKWQKETKDWAGYDISIASSSQTSMMGGGSNVEIILQGIDRNALSEASVLVEDIMYANPELTHVSSTVTAREPQADIRVNPIKANAVGLTPVQVIGSLYKIIGGDDSATLTQNGREYDVRVEYPRDKYRTISDISGVMMMKPTGEMVPLLDIATIEYTTSPQSIYRSDNQYQITISAQPSQAAKLTVADDIKAKIEETGLPQGVTIAPSSMDQSMVDEFTSIITAIVTALMLMFIVMAMQFESARFSLMVMICIPFSIVGAFILMWITGITISMTSLMGFLLLFSTVINNGILFIDTAVEYQSQGMDAETALIESGISRMRPILMTSAVSLISMIPEGLGIGDGAEIMQGMAIVIIGGLVASTILTLLVLPTFYLIFKGRKKDKPTDTPDSSEPPEEIDDSKELEPALLV